MVQTRRQYQAWIQQQRQDDNDLMNMLPSQASSLGFLSQNSLPNLSLSQIPAEDFPTVGQAMYRPNDRHKKHRLPDDSPYTTTIRTHKRRTPK